MGSAGGGAWEGLGESPPQKNELFKRKVRFPEGSLLASPPQKNELFA